MAGGEGPDGDDPLDGLVLDESFVAGASVREPTAEERRARLQRIDSGHRRLQDEWAVSRRLAQQAERRRRRLRVGALLGAAVVVAAVATGRFDPRDLASPTGSPTGGATVFAPVGPQVDQPPPAPRSPTPLGQPPVTPADDRFAFVATQSGSDAPVAHDPCREITLVVNDRTRPGATGDGVLRDAIVEVEAATGLRISIEGTTDEVPTADRAAVQEERYGDRWAPVLVAWSDPEELSELDGDVAGIGGGRAFTPAGGDSVYVSGLVALDGPQLDDLLGRPGGRAQAQAVVMHELAHLVGLDHIEDPTQLMNPEGSAEVVGFAAGDRAGLAALGAGDCFPDV